MSGSNTHVAGAGSPRQVRNAFFTGLNINATEASRTAITSGTGGVAGRIAVGDVLIRDPYGHDNGAGTLNSQKNSTDFTVPQTNFLHEQALVVVTLMEGKGPQTRSGSTYYPQAFQGIELSEAEQVLVKANITAGTTVLGLVNGQTALGALTGSTITDSSGGTASATLSANTAKQNLIFGPIPLALVVNSQIWAIPVPYAFTLAPTPAVPVIRFPIAVTTGGKGATFTVSTTAGAITGGVITASGAQATNTSTNGSAMSGANATGTAGQFVLVTASAVTAYSEGYGTIEVPVINNDLANSLATLAAGINNLPKVKGVGLETHDSSATAAVKPVKFIGPFQVGGL
jgi:hypothetical protein